VAKIKNREKRLGTVESLAKECFGRGFITVRERDDTIGVYNRSSSFNVASIEVKSYAGSMILRDWNSLATASFFVEQYKFLNLESPGMRKTLLNRLGIKSFILKVDYRD